MTAPSAARLSSARWILRFAVAATGVVLGLGFASGSAHADTLLGKTGEAVHQTTKSAAKIVHHSATTTKAVTAKPKQTVAARPIVRKAKAPVRTQVRQVTRAVRTQVVHRPKPSHVAQRPVVKHVTKKVAPAKVVTAKVVKRTTKQPVRSTVRLTETLVHVPAAAGELTTGIIPTAVPSLVLPLVDQVTSPLLPVVDSVAPGILRPVAPPLAISPPVLVVDPLVGSSGPMPAAAAAAARASSPSLTTLLVTESDSPVASAPTWLLPDTDATAAGPHRPSALQRLVAAASTSPVLLWTSTGQSGSLGLAASGEAGSGAAGSVGLALAAGGLLLATVARDRQVSGASVVPVWTAPRHPGFSPD